MFNILKFKFLIWYEFFITLNYSFVFLFCFTLIFYFVVFSLNNEGFFFNIFIFLVLLTIFLFNQNSGAFAGFLFLCETVSLFTIFIILNKISNDDLLLNNKFFQNKIYFSFITVLFLFYLYKVYVVCTNNNLDNFYQYEIFVTNDFWTTSQLFYSNTYNSFLFICFFLTILSCFIILNVQSKLFLLSLKDSSAHTKNSIGVLISILLKENNFMFFKNNVFLHYFKK